MNYSVDNSDEEQENGNGEVQEYYQTRGRAVPCQPPIKYKAVSIDESETVNDILEKIESLHKFDHSEIIRYGRTVSSAAVASEVKFEISDSLNDQMSQNETEPPFKKRKFKDANSGVTEDDEDENNDSMYLFANLSNSQFSLEKYLSDLMTAKGYLQDYASESKEAIGYPVPGFLRTTDDIGDWRKSDHAYEVVVSSDYNQIVPNLDIDLKSLNESENVELEKEFLSYINELFCKCPNELLQNAMDSQNDTLRLMNFLKSKSFKSADDSFCELMKELLPDEESPQEACQFCKSFSDECLSDSTGDEEVTGEDAEDERLHYLLSELKSTSYKLLNKKNQIMMRLDKASKSKSLKDKINSNTKRVWDYYSEYLKFLKSEQLKGADLAQLEKDQNWSKQTREILKESLMLQTELQKIDLTPVIKLTEISNNKRHVSKNVPPEVIPISNHISNFVSEVDINSSK